jgi:hypothetical protein
MRESYDEGIASHVGPESCAGAREGSGEALTGVRVGRVLSREMVLESRVQTPWTWRKATRCASIVREAHGPCAVVDPVARTETPCTGIGRSHGCLCSQGNGGRVGKSEDTSR